MGGQCLHSTNFARSSLPRAILFEQRHYGWPSLASYFAAVADGDAVAALLLLLPLFLLLLPYQRSLCKANVPTASFYLVAFFFTLFLLFEIFPTST